jgi:hypothetical protein
MKLDYNKHYINKSKTKHYYMNHIFDNFEWSEFIRGIRVQNLSIGINDKHRLIPETCERWHSINNIASPCKNEIFYRSSNGVYLCKKCAKEVNKINDTIIFSRIK